MPIELAGIKLHRVHRVVTLEQAALVYHRIPGLEGNVVQDLGRDSVRLQIDGIFYGAQAQADLEKLRKVYKKRQPVDFLADIVGQAYFGQVTLERFDVFQRAAEPDQFSYTLVVAEYVKPPKPAQAAGPSSVDQAIALDAQAFMEMATLPDALSLGQIPELTNPAEPLSGALDQITVAAEGLGSVTEALDSLGSLTVDPAPPPPAVEPPPDEPLDWGPPPPPVDPTQPPAVGLNGQPLGGQGELVGPDGQPILGPNGALLGANGKPLLGPNGELLGSDGQPLRGPDGTLIGPNGQALGPDGQPLLGSNGELLGPDGQPLLGPNGELLGPDGQPLPGPDGQGLGPDGQPLDIGRLALTLVDEEGQPLAGARYQVSRDDDVIAEGQLDRRGQALLKNIALGAYSIAFPDLDAVDWDLSERDKAAEAEKEAKAEAEGEAGVAAGAKAGWLGLEVIDEDGQPLAGMRYELKLTDGTTEAGQLDETGQARVEGLAAGSYGLTFPELDAADWGPVEAEAKSGWLGLELVDEAGQPLAGVQYRISRSSEIVREGRLDAQGQARLVGLEPGSYTLTWLDVDGADWKNSQV